MRFIGFKKSFDLFHRFLASYGSFGALDMLVCVLITKMRFRNARIMRLPTYLRGKRWIKVGEGFTTGRALRMEAFPNDTNDRIRIEIGDHVQLNDYVHIAAVDSVRIGDHVLLASKVFISDHNHGRYSGEGQDSPDIPPIERALHSSPIVIGRHVWIGEFVSILPGVHIGEGSIIGTMSVVTRDIPPFSIAVGSPARVIKRFSFERHCWEKL